MASIASAPGARDGSRQAPRSTGVGPGPADPPASIPLTARAAAGGLLTGTPVPAWPVVTRIGAGFTGPTLPGRQGQPTAQPRSRVG
jgi:hypothetical protein